MRVFVCFAPDAQTVRESWEEGLWPLSDVRLFEPDDGEGSQNAYRQRISGFYQSVYFHVTVRVLCRVLSRIMQSRLMSLLFINSQPVMFRQWMLYLSMSTSRLIKRQGKQMRIASHVVDFHWRGLDLGFFMSIMTGKLFGLLLVEDERKQEILSDDCCVLVIKSRWSCCRRVF